MNCKKCGGKTKVIDTVCCSKNKRHRQRKCFLCGRVFYTTEIEVEYNDQFYKEWSEPHTKNKKTKKQYTLYLAKDDSIVASGTAKECAEQMGVTESTFKSTVSRAKSGERKKYEVYIFDGNEDFE